ncbi:MAG: efflux RND transporter permease subunit [Candidatus Nomurabacteria bacterium]|nr:MAG: efflux RND transporter permease subunit [Candidatus Nomurabacteria bacterium]HRV75817.1 efflux RND transporter permease subunit [Candidatus Saccharimonadales bacterium]
MFKKKLKNENKGKLSLLQKFSLFFFKNKRFSLFAWISLLVLGLVTYTGLIQREGFPSVQVPISVVNANYFVGDKEKVDSEVSLPISNVLKSVPQIKEVSSTSTDNFANILVTYRDDVSSEEGSKLTKEKIDSTSLPTQVKVEYQTIDASKFANEYNLLVGVYSEKNNDITDTSKAAEGLATKLKEVDGVASSKVIPQLQTALDPRTGQESKIQNSFDILGVENESTGKVDFFNTVNIGVKFKEGQDALEASDNISKAIEDYVSSGSLNDFKATVSADFAPLVRSQISSLQENMLEGFVIVALISFILVSWRAGLATALTMVSVILSTVTLLYLFGVTLNVISLFALILSLGLIVDDATIISEAIDSFKDHSADRSEVVKEAIGKIARASMAGTLTTIFAFVPMLFISGILGGFIRAIPITIIISLALSLILSLSLIPFFASGFLLSKPKKTPRLNPVQKFEKYASTKLSNLIRYAGRNRKKGGFITAGFILLSLMATMVGGTYFGKAGFDIFPKEKDSTELAINVTFRPGSSIADAIEQSSEVNSIISQESEFIKQVTYSGTGTNQNASISITLTELDEREDTSVQIASRLQDSFNSLKSQGILATASSSGAGGPGGDFPLEIRVMSDNKEAASELLSEVKTKLSQEDFMTLSGKEFKVSKFLVSDTDTIIKRIDSQSYTSLSVGFDTDSSTELIETTRTFVKDNINPEDFGLPKDALVTDAGFEESNQESFKSMMIAFPIMLLGMYILLAVQFKSLLQPIFIFLAIPFSFLGVGMGLYYTNNSASFFVMLGFFALIGIALNNTILITDLANQERRKGVGRIESIARALQARFRPLLTTSITSVVALIPLALQDPFWQSLSVTLIFGLLSSTLLVILCFPYYLVAVEVLRSAGRKSIRIVRRKKK